MPGETFVVRVGLQVYTDLNVFYDKNDNLTIIASFSAHWLVEADLSVPTEVKSGFGTPKQSQDNPLMYMYLNWDSWTLI